MVVLGFDKLRPSGVFREMGSFHVCICAAPNFAQVRLGATQPDS